MTTDLGWPEIILRLALTLVAGAIIGFDRGEHGRPAGMRTTMLVCLAASISMIQVNLLLNLNGKSPSSFIVMDLMRLPLGILSGMGFIGGGAILRKDNLVTGVTTAATLWFVTVVGLCLGGGQLAVGMVAVFLGLLILSGLKKWEKHWHQEQRGILTVVSEKDSPDEKEIAQQIKSFGGKVAGWLNLSYGEDDGCRERACAVTWTITPDDPQPPPFLKAIAEKRGALRVNWKV